MPTNVAAIFMCSYCFIFSRAHLDNSSNRIINAKKFTFTFTIFDRAIGSHDRILYLFGHAMATLSDMNSLFIDVTVSQTALLKKPNKSLVRGEMSLLEPPKPSFSSQMISFAVILQPISSPTLWKFLYRSLMCLKRRLGNSSGNLPVQSQIFPYSARCQAPFTSSQRADCSCKIMDRAEHCGEACNQEPALPRLHAIEDSALLPHLTPFLESQAENFQNNVFTANADFTLLHSCQLSQRSLLECCRVNRVAVRLDAT